ncbi:MAG TPA: sigma 54-interacting transcriptional regulator [Blastocatellia bacterium]|nr:sigma 54-interacting transcriptional regulator [Blastocatellia bacterium]
MISEAIATLPVPRPRPPHSLAESPGGASWRQFECFIGVSARITELKEFVCTQAALSQPVLLAGERGLRQEQIARALHLASERREQPFFAVNARGLNDDALDHLLFGSRGAMAAIKGGTIYINELIGLPALAQQRLAVYLEEQRSPRAIRRAAGPRLVFATDDDNAERTAENRLAFGLIEQLRSSSFRLKPLRERSEDIPYLAVHLGTRIANRLGKSAHEITPEAMDMLMLYEWKRNIDELEAALESAIANTPPPRIDETLLPDRVRHATLRAIPPDGVDLPRIVADYERSIIETALRQTSGNQTKAARLLGLRVQTLNMKLKRFAELNRPLTNLTS